MFRIKFIRLIAIYYRKFLARRASVDNIVITEEDRLFYKQFMSDNLISDAQVKELKYLAIEKSKELKLLEKDESIDKFIFNKFDVDL